MTNMNVLYELQKIYDEEQKLKRKLQESVTSLEVLKKQLDSVIIEKTGISEKFHQIKRKLGDENFKLQTEESTWKKLNNELYTTHQSNPRYLKDLENKISEISKLRETEEEIILYLLDDLDQITKKQTLIEQQEKEIKEAFSTKTFSKEGLELQIKEDLFTLSMEKKTMRGQLDQEVLDVFDKMMMQCQGKAVAILSQGECGVCRFLIPLSQTEVIKKNRDQIHYCSNCKRILLAV